jgi:outer membrane protein TolC
MMLNKLRKFVPFCCALSALLPLGCTARWAHESADAEVYPIVAEKQKAALGKALPFRIETTTSTLTQQVLDTTTRTADTYTTGALVLSMADALELALDNNREYQARKEDLYLSALALTGERHEFSPIFTSLVSSRLQRQPAGTDVERFGQLSGDLKMTQLLATGGRITVGFTNNLFHFYSGGNPRNQSNNALAIGIVQPLLQGGGLDVTLENLRQAERNVIYAARLFARYRQSFIIDRVESYLAVLETRDRIDNEYMSYQRLVFQRERSEAMEEAQRLERFQVDQARQDEYKARNRWINAQTEYQVALDQFKLELGLPLDLKLQPDSHELDVLRGKGLLDMPLDLPTALQEAVARRLDMKTALDHVQDAMRGVLVAQNGLLPGLDVSTDYGLQDDGSNQTLNLAGKTRRYGAGIDLDLPLDRKQERNDFRRAEIERERANRTAEQLRNQIQVQVRKAYNDLQDARESFRIQEAAANLAQHRIENVRMLLDIGREGVNVRDQLEAESALRDTQNNITTALVGYTVARLRFYDAMERLEIDERGEWHEQKTATQKL